MDSKKKKALRDEFFALAKEAGDPGPGLLATAGLRPDPAYLPAVEAKWSSSTSRDPASIGRERVVVSGAASNHFEGGAVSLGG